MPSSSSSSPSTLSASTLISRLCTARYLFKKHLFQTLFRRIAFIGDHLLRTTEHLQQSYAVRIRSQLFYNEVMGCLETVAEGCTTVRDDWIAKGVLPMTWSLYQAGMATLAIQIKKLRFVCQHQGVSQLVHLAGIEFDCPTSSSSLDWWQRFVNTSFIPLAYNLYRIRKHSGEIVSANTRDPFEKGPKRRFSTAHNYEGIDVARIHKLLGNPSLENRCYIVTDAKDGPTSVSPPWQLNTGLGTNGGVGGSVPGSSGAAGSGGTGGPLFPVGSSAPSSSTTSGAPNPSNGPPTSTSTAVTTANVPLPPSKVFGGAGTVSLVEYINGARVYVPFGDYVVALSGYFRNDSFQMMTNHVPLLAKTQQLQQLIKTNSVVPDAFTVGWTQQLSLRDQLVYDVHELNEHCIREFQRLQHLKSKTISTLVKEFLSSPLYVQREIMTLFLLTEHNSDTQYLAYLMYDMISQESYLLKPQPLAEEIYNNLHWTVKKRFRVVIENIHQFTKQLSTFNETDINYESRILLMKAPDAVKKKAMEKLKEVQSKSGNDTNHKAQQYLDGILRIPFGIYRREHMFTFLQGYRDRLHMYCEQYCSTVGHTNHPTGTQPIAKLHQDMLNHRNTGILTFNRIDAFLTTAGDAFEQSTVAFVHQYDAALLLKCLNSQTYTELTRLMGRLKKAIGSTQLDYGDLASTTTATQSQSSQSSKSSKSSKKPKKSKLHKVRMRHKVNGKIVRLDTSAIVDQLMAFCAYAHAHYPERWVKIQHTIPYQTYDPQREMHQQFHKQLTHFRTDWDSFKHDTKAYMQNVDNVLEASVYGHANAKRSIKQVIAQWITGDLKGYCFGFEGPPGTGKTSLAKNGLSKCLVDINGERRPFAFIALGGSSNGSTLEGHSYTYVGSIWGRIVDILMETECMNPIIYIDELDKISRTEHGRELIGILTHMTDSTQNEEFMDKYFSGIKIDLSRVLFVFSYNDADLLDPILRDRIHVVRFSPLKQADKHEVCSRHLVPEILRTVGLSAQDILFPTATIDFIIDHYTAEGGVRRLKEKLFEISRDLNIRHLVDDDAYAFPYTVTPEFLQNDLFAEHPIVRTKKILETARVGLTNGMYATSLGVGGITIIECFVVPKTSFMALELTGQQGDVMKESMSVAKTVAWNLLTEATKADLHAKSKENGFGLHIHCPDGGTPKDGPSAGTAITVSILSSLLGVPVNNTVAITGEIDLNGQVCQIGGLDTKVRGAKKAGVSTVLFPKSNEHDLQSIQKHYSPFAEGAFEYTMVETIWDVLPFVFPGCEYAFVRF